MKVELHTNCTHGNANGFPCISKKQVGKVYGDFTTHHSQPDTTDTLIVSGHGIKSLDYERHKDFKAPKPVYAYNTK